jgi:hypothetical protein
MRIRAAVFDFGETVVNVPAREIAYVGDRVDNDIVPASAAGMFTVRVRRGLAGGRARQRSRRPDPRSRANGGQVRETWTDRVRSLEHAFRTQATGRVGAFVGVGYMKVLSGTPCNPPPRRQ